MLHPVRMDLAPGRWMRLNPDNVAMLPDEGGIFEVANLVRNVVLIGRADGNLRQRLESLTQPGNTLPANIGGYYVRVMVTAAEETALADRLTDFSAKHRGRPPQANGDRRRTLRLAQRQAA